MRQNLNFLLRSFLFWTLWFMVGRWVFLIYQTDQVSDLTAGDLLMINLLGLRMDLSMAGYLMIIPALVLLLGPWAPMKMVGRILHGFNFIMLGATTLITVADLELYRHWGFRMDGTPLLYIRPEGFGSVRLVAYIILTAAFALLLTLGVFSYRKWIAVAFPAEKTERNSVMIPLLSLVLLIIPIRSGFGIAPLNTGFVYFHPTNAFANHAGINVSWNFFRSLLYSDQTSYTEKLLDDKEAEHEFSKLVFKPDSTTRLIRHPQPNIILIVLESFTSKAIDTENGKALAPNLRGIVDTSILFDSLYASGDRTDKGIASILSGYPAQPRSSIVKYPSKTRTLPMWPRLMKEMGYRTSFLYGGDARFANMESYLVSAGFDQMTGQDDFPDDLPRSKWGVHDEHLFSRLMNTLDTSKAPFFTCILTLSSHEPFDVPYGTIKPGDSDEKLFLNAVRYTDSVVGSFIDQARNKPWWKDTWIIFTADHGHLFPGNKPVMDPSRFRIPMIWTGGAVADTALIIRKTSSQLDIVNTALHQIGPYREEFKFSKDILANSTPPFAVYAYNNGYAFLSTGNRIIYDFGFGKYLERRLQQPEAERYARGFMQTLFNDYNSR